MVATYDVPLVVFSVAIAQGAVPEAIAFIACYRNFGSKASPLSGRLCAIIE